MFPDFDEHKMSCDRCPPRPRQRFRFCPGCFSWFLRMHDERQFWLIVVAIENPTHWDERFRRASRPRLVYCSRRAPDHERYSLMRQGWPDPNGFMMMPFHFEDVDTEWTGGRLGKVWASIAWDGRAEGASSVNLMHQHNPHIPGSDDDDYD
jgi:hypothetical protein